MVQCGDSSVFLFFDVAVTTKEGDVRVAVGLARSLLDCAELKNYSEGELALLFFMQCGVPGS